MSKQYWMCSSSFPKRLVKIKPFVSKTKTYLSCTFEEDAEAEDPLLPVDVAVVVGVEALEDPVEEDVVRHVERVVEELAEPRPVQTVDFDGCKRRFF